jgi:hypothetical protein
MRRIAAVAALAATLIASTACAQTSGAARQSQAPGAWIELAPGNSIAAWRGYKTDTVPPGWSVVDGVLSKQRPVADIITREQFGDFELSLEWKISDGGNAGIFYRGTEEYPRVYWSAPEYQLLDDAKAPDGKNRLTSAGSAYGLYPPPEGHLKPVGEWNATRILAKGGKVEHWLNGVKLLEYELWSADWTAKVKASKFNAWPNYGLAKRGHIALQGDHAGTLAFRNVKIRELK